MRMNLLTRLWRDQRGTLDTASWLLLTCLIAIGCVVGVASVRDQIVQQFGDMAVALESLDQSYSFSIVTPSATMTSMYTDPPTTLTDPLDAEPAGIVIGGVPATPE